MLHRGIFQTLRQTPAFAASIYYLEMHLRAFLSGDLFHRHTRRCQVPTELLLKFFVILSECYSYLFNPFSRRNCFHYFYHFTSPPPFHLLLHLPLADNPKVCGHWFPVLPADWSPHHYAISSPSGTPSSRRCSTSSCR